MRLTNRLLAIGCGVSLTAVIVLTGLRALANEQCWDTQVRDCAAVKLCDPMCTLSGTRICAGQRKAPEERLDECVKVTRGNIICENDNNPNLRQILCYYQYNCAQTTFACPFHEDCFYCMGDIETESRVCVPPHKAYTVCPRE